MFNKFYKNILPIVSYNSTSSYTKTSVSLSNPLPLLTISMWNNKPINDFDYLAPDSTESYYYFIKDCVVKINFIIAIKSINISNTAFFGIFNINDKKLLQDGNYLNISLSAGSYKTFLTFEKVFVVPKNYSIGVGLNAADDLKVNSSYIYTTSIYLIK